MAAENTTWGQERIANELQLKLGIRVSPRTVAKYLRRGGPVRTPDPKQRWLTFVHNHAQVIVACDFFVAITATFRTLYVFVLMEVGILDHLTPKLFNPNETPRNAGPGADMKTSMSCGTSLPPSQPRGGP